jgi:putative PEP-CTERM system TPR-repeat lipoprotein
VKTLKLQRALAPALLALSATVMTACGAADDPAELVASAKQYLAKDDSAAAIIQLKTALQQDPNAGEARFLLGKALLASGDAAGAAIELRKALDQQFDENQVAPELARALLVRGDFQRLSQQFGSTVLSDRSAEADLKVTLARMYGGLGQRDKARAAASAALAAVPDYGPANIFMARLRADTGDIDGSLDAIDRQLQQTPQDAEGWQVKGDLLALGKRDTDGALEAYRQALKVKPDSVPAHSGALTVLLSKQDLEGAKAQLAELQKVLPRHPQTLYFSGNVALLERNLDRAQEISQQLLRVAPDNPRVLQFAGAVEFERGSLVQAEAHLAKALQLAPGLDVSRRLLTMTHLRRAEPAKALTVLQPLLERPNPIAAVWSMKAQAHVQQGQLQEAEEAFAQASKLNPDDARSQTALAVSRVLQGETDAGLAQLRSLAADEDSSVADLPLIATLVRKRDFPGALKAIDELEKKQPDRPVASNLRARILLAQGDRPGAVKAFERALEIQPSFFPAAAALAQIALAEKRPADAQAIVDKVLAADPKNSQALIASAALKARAGAKREEIVAMFTRAIQQVPTDAAPRLALINYQLAQKEVPAALSAAQQAVAALPDHAGLLDALGRAQAASGDTNQAISSFNKLAQMLPTSPAPYLRLADVQWAAQRQDAAVQALGRALSVDPDNLQAQRALVDAYLAQDKTRDAIRVARDIQTQRPKQDVGYLVEGGIEASKQRWEPALAAYRKGLQAVPDSTQLATRIHVALTAAKKPADADRHAAVWLKAHPKDAGFRFYLGDLALAKRDLPEAEKQYREVLELQPENALALNNVAWLMATAKKPGAVALAEKAVELLPDRPVIMDTLATALAAEGQPDKGVDIMRQALALDDKNPMWRLNLARLLIQAGDKTAARTELDTLAALGDKFPRQKDVEALRAQL